MSNGSEVEFAKTIDYGNKSAVFRQGEIFFLAAYGWKKGIELVRVLVDQQCLRVC